MIRKLEKDSEYCTKITLEVSFTVNSVGTSNCCLYHFIVCFISHRHAGHMRQIIKVNHNIHIDLGLLQINASHPVFNREDQYIFT